VILAASSSEETKLKNEQSQIDNEKKEAESDLEEIQAQKSETMQQVEDLSTQISNYESQIEALDGQISELNTKINESEQELQKAQEDYTKQQELLEARLVATYEAGETSYLDFILSSNSITDLISNYYLVTEVATNDAELLEKIDQQKQEIEAAKQKLESSKQELSTSKASKQSITTQLQTAKNEKNQQVAKLSEDEKEIQEHIDELQQASASIEKEIKAAQERYAAQIAALNSKNNSSSSSSSSNTSSGGSSTSGGNYTSGGSGVLQRPVSTGTITATMYYSNGSFHGALDYGVPVGTPVYAAADGVVITTANLSGSYGTYVVIQHADGLQTWYGHGTSGSICVSPGQSVSKGQKIMLSGNTGNSSGPHLHFEVRVSPYNYSTCRVDPRNYF
jgi:murein DD-endopeptidase MepM/ murein hydrolase activator NlpD